MCTSQQKDSQTKGSKIKTIKDIITTATTDWKHEQKVATTKRSPEERTTRKQRKREIVCITTTEAIGNS